MTQFAPNEWRRNSKPTSSIRSSQPLPAVSCGVKQEFSMQVGVWKFHMQLTGAALWSEDKHFFPL